MLPMFLLVMQLWLWYDPNINSLYDCVYSSYHISVLNEFSNFNELAAWNKGDIWNLGYCNGIGTHIHLLRKKTQLAI